MDYKYFLIAILVLFFSCENTKEKQDDLIVFENATKYDENTISFKDFRFVKLDNNLDAIVGEDIKMNIYKNDIYLLDMISHGVLFRFDANGNFINKIGKLGKGPKEYLEVEDFCIYKDTINMLVYSQSMNIFRYLFNGNLTEIRKTTGNFEISFEQLPNGNFVINPYYTDKNIYRLNVVNDRTEIVNKFLPVRNENWLNLQSQGIGFTKIDDFIVFADFYTDTVYNIINNNVVPKYVMDFGSHSNQSIDYESYNNKRELLQQEVDRGLWYIRKCYENKDCFLIRFDQINPGNNLKSRLLLYNKKDEKITTLILDDKKTLRRNFMGLTKDNEIVFIMYPFGDEFEEFNQLFPDVAIPALGETDNAMLVFCKI